MANNVSGGLPNRGKTYHGGTPSSIGRSVALEGTAQDFKDDYESGAGPRLTRSARYCSAVLVRNTSGIALTPSRLVSWESGYTGKRVDGYTTTTGAEAAGVVDPELPATGVADDDLFWLFVKGPCLVTSDLAGGANNVLAIGQAVGALTAATSGATTAGRIVAVATGTTATLPSTIINRIGRAMSAATTANTGGVASGKILIDLNIVP